MRLVLPGSKASPVYLAVNNCCEDVDGFGGLVERRMQVKNEVITGVSVQVSLCLHQIPHRMVWARSWVAIVRGRRQTARN